MYVYFVMYCTQCTVLMYIIGSCGDCNVETGDSEDCRQVHLELGNRMSSGASLWASEGVRERDRGVKSRTLKVSTLGSLPEHIPILPFLRDFTRCPDDLRGLTLMRINEHSARCGRLFAHFSVTPSYFSMFSTSTVLLYM